MWVVAFVLTSTFAGYARAQQSNEPTTIDAVRGTIRGSTRFIGLAGAFVAIADDTKGVPINPASVAVRLPYSWDAFSYGFGVDFSVASWLPKNDIYNQPEEPNRNGALFGSIAAIVNYRHAGFGLSAEAEQNDVSHRAQGVSANLTANFGLVHLDTAYGFFEGQLLLGAGMRVLGLSFDSSSRRNALLTSGLGATAGFIVKPTGQQFRIGAAVEQAIDAHFEGDAATPPTTMHVPWTAALGLAYQFGSRPLNRPFVTAGDRARQNAAGCEPTDDDTKEAAKQLFDEYQKEQTWYLLVTTELAVLEGPHNAPLGNYVPIDRMLFSPRLGLESEVVPGWLRLRGGSYVELPVTKEGEARVHGTAGADIKLFAWSVFGLVHPFDYWQLSLAADGAKHYLNTSFSVGFWH